MKEPLLADHFIAIDRMVYEKLRKEFGPETRSFNSAIRKALGMKPTKITRGRKKGSKNRPKESV